MSAGIDATTITTTTAAAADSPASDAPSAARRKRHHLTEDAKVSLIRHIVDNGCVYDYAFGKTLGASAGVVKRLGRIACDLKKFYGSATDVSDELIRRHLPATRRGRPAHFFCDADEVHFVKGLVAENEAIDPKVLRQRYMQRYNRHISSSSLQRLLQRENLLVRMHRAREDFLARQRYQREGIKRVYVKRDADGRPKPLGVPLMQVPVDTDDASRPSQAVAAATSNTDTTTTTTTATATASEQSHAEENSGDGSGDDNASEQDEEAAEQVAPKPKRARKRMSLTDMALMDMPRGPSRGPLPLSFIAFRHRAHVNTTNRYL